MVLSCVCAPNLLCVGYHSIDNGLLSVAGIPFGIEALPFPTGLGLRHSPDARRGALAKRMFDLSLFCTSKIDVAAQCLRHSQAFSVYTLTKASF